jgi:hypothetical protein
VVDGHGYPCSHGRPVAAHVYRPGGLVHPITAPEEYAEEAHFYLAIMEEGRGAPIQSLLDVGSRQQRLPLQAHCAPRRANDLTAAMLRISEMGNPACEHVQGDMRSLRLDRTFDAVFVQ